MKEKKPLTLKQKKNRYLIKSKLLYASKPVVVASPLAITMSVKSNEWFATDWKVATGGTIAIIIMALSALLVNKKTEDKTITNSWISLIIGWTCVAFIFMLLRDIADEIYWIMLVAETGMLAGAGIDYVEKKEYGQYQAIKNATEEVEQDILKEKLKEELLNGNKKEAVD